jgi:hypothetical protein
LFYANGSAPWQFLYTNLFSAMFGRRSFSAILLAASLLFATTSRAADAPPTKGTVKLASSTLPAPAAAQPEAAQPAEGPHLVTLAGTIVGPNGEPRPGVCVFPTTNPRLLAVTDAHGTFQLQVPATAALRLQAEYVGLGSTRFDVDGQHPQALRIVLGE